MAILPLSETHPHLIAEWHPKNDKTVDQVSKGVEVKFWWVCDLGHEWEASPNNRTNRGSGCPYCAGKKVLVGFNDLVTLRPDLISQWHPSNSLPPTAYVQCSGKSVKWLCDAGHSWLSTISNRTFLGNGCPHCVDHQNPKIEQNIDSVLSSQFVVQRQEPMGVTWGIRRWKNRPIKVDFWLPDLNTIVEYDGERWHSGAVNPESPERDRHKTSRLLGAGYRVVRLRQGKLFFLDIEHPNLTQLRFQWSADIAVVTSRLSPLIDLLQTYRA